MPSSSNQLVALSERMPPGGGKIEGASPLTGHLDLVSLLVRECVQNAWDARDDDRGDAPVHFAIDAWDFDGDEVKALSSLLPVSKLRGFARNSDADGNSGVVHPKSLLSRSTLRALVISDRNTVGLCGPTRSGLRWDPIKDGRPLVRGQQRFANFVRNTGRATANIGGGDGGAYGVGKSILWMLSKTGTILIHTRTTDEDGRPVERFIGSVHGDHFYDDCDEYTGRHFVGLLAGDARYGEIIEPLTGAAAADAAALLHIPPYEVDGRPAGGTSVVILDPRLSLDWNRESLRIRDAIRWHVWPKRVPGVRSDQPGPDMEMRLTVNNTPVNLVPPLQDPEISKYAVTLQHCVSDRTDLEANRDFKIACKRPAKTLGSLKFRNAGAADDNTFHVTLTKDQLSSAANSDDGDEADTEPITDFDQPWGQIALIRREPLLLVRYEPIDGPAAASTFVGVFLSAEDPEVEEALTKAEPPAHNVWDYKNIRKNNPKDHRPTFAKRAVEELKSARLAFLREFATHVPLTAAQGEQALSAAISGGLFGGNGGDLKPPPSPPPPPPPPPKRPSAELRPIRSEQRGDISVHELEVVLKGVGATSSEVTLRVEGAGYDNAGSMSLDGHLSYSWVTSEGAATDGDRVTFTGADGDSIVLEVSVLGNFRFRPKVTVEMNHGA